MLTTADFDNNGTVDIITVSNGANMFGFSSGNGDGTFGTEVVFAEPSVDGATLIANDINNDGNQDLINVVNANDMILVRLGNGDGTFASSQTFDTAASGPDTVISEDFNGDGFADLAVSGTSGDIEYFQGNGDGTFQAAVTFPSIDATTNIVAADFNGDGELDIFANGGGSNYYNVWIGNGDGTFDYTAGEVVTQMGRPLAIGDFNNDGVTDVVGGNLGTAVGVVLGNGDGTFGAEITYQVGDMPNSLHSVRSGDLNGDEVDDIVAFGADDSTVSALISNGDGTFAAPSTYAVTASDWVLELTDLTGDGALDLVTGDFGGAFGVLIANTQEVSGLSVDLTTQDQARTALDSLAQALQSITGERGRIGAMQSRLEVASREIQTRVIAFKAAESQIRDADVAAEAAELVRKQILQQAGAAVLGQANQQPGIALQLLGGL